MHREGHQTPLKLKSVKNSEKYAKSEKMVLF